MEPEGERTIFSSQENGHEMYKLTYDSEDNEEVHAPVTPPPGTRKPSSPDYETKMKIEAKESKDTEKGNGQILSPNQKRTKDTGVYEGNGRFYSLFANDNFVTEDPAKRRKACLCAGIKTVLYIGTVVILIFAILGLMWVVRGLQVQYDNMERRVAVLEGAASSTLGGPTTSRSASDYHEAVNSLLQRLPNPDDPPPPMPPSAGDLECCGSNINRIDHISEVLNGHVKRFEDLEAKLARHTSEDGIQDAEIFRSIAENMGEVGSAHSMIQTVKTMAHEAQAEAETAKKLAMVALKDADLTEEEVKEYLETVQGNKSDNRVTFSVAHAMGNDYVIGSDVKVGRSAGVPPMPFYDVNVDFAPIISFTEEKVDSGGYIEPVSGTFQVANAGNYVVFVSFCVHSDRDTTINLMRNGKVLREMEISALSPTIGAQDDEEKLIPPPGFVPVNDELKFFAPPPATPSFDSSVSHIRPYQFTEVTALEEGDTVYLKIAKGAIAEYANLPGSDAAESCTRFAGYQL